jgi:predicted Zn-dependent peptidase
VSNIGHQLGFFETIATWRYFPDIASRIDAVTLEEVAKVAVERLRPTNSVIGRFEPR